jgi:hypothetical protein
MALAEAQPWAEKGYMMAWEQFLIPSGSQRFQFNGFPENFSRFFKEIIFGSKAGISLSPLIAATADRPVHPGWRRADVLFTNAQLLAPSYG